MGARVRTGDASGCSRVSRVRCSERQRPGLRPPGWPSGGRRLLQPVERRDFGGFGAGAVGCRMFYPDFLLDRRWNRMKDGPGAQSAPTALTTRGHTSSPTRRSPLQGCEVWLGQSLSRDP